MRYAVADRDRERILYRHDLAAISALPTVATYLTGNRSRLEADDFSGDLLATHCPHDVIRHAVGHLDER